MQADPGVTYYSEGRTVLCAPGDDGYPSRVVGEMPSEQGAAIRARVLQRVAQFDSADAAREIEATLANIDAEKPIPALDSATHSIGLPL